MKKILCAVIIGFLLPLSQAQVGMIPIVDSGVPAPPAASAFVQGFTDPNFTFTTPHTIGSFSGSTTAHNTIIVVITAANNFVTPVISDTQGNTFTTIESLTTSGTCFCYVVAAAFNIVGGADTVSISWGGGNSISSNSVAEYTCTATCGVDVHTSTHVSPTWVEPSTVGPLTATVSDIALTVIAGTTSATGTTWPEPTATGYTNHNGVNDNNTTGRGSKIADKNIGAGAFSATWTSTIPQPSGESWLVLIGIHH